MTAAEFCRKMIDEWEAKSCEASEHGDYKAFEAAERELANYREMLARWE